MPQFGLNYLSLLRGSDPSDEPSSDGVNSSILNDIRSPITVTNNITDITEYSIWNKTRDFITVHWSLIADFGSKQSNALLRTVENVKITAKNNPGTSAFILSTFGALIILMFCALLLKYRRRSGEARPLLGESNATGGEADDSCIGQAEAQSKIAEMRKKMKRKSMSRFSVDFDRFNADIHQCSAESANDKNVEHNSFDEIRSNSVSNANRTATTTVGVHPSIPGSMIATLSNLIKDSGNDSRLALSSASAARNDFISRPKSYSMPNSPLELFQPDDWIEEDVENVLFVSRMNSFDASALGSGNAVQITDAQSGTGGVTRNADEEDDRDDVCPANVFGDNNDFELPLGTKWRSASGSGSFSDESAGYCSETGCSTPELTV